MFSDNSYLILVQHLPKYHCDDFHVVLLYHLLIIAYQSQEKCYLNCSIDILKIHKTIKSNCFLTTPPDYCSASSQVPLWWFSCCFTVSFFNNCIPKSRKMLFKLLNRHILKIHKTIKSNCFLTTPPDYCSASSQVPLWWFSCCFTVSFFNNCITKVKKNAI